MKKICICTITSCILFINCLAQQKPLAPLSVGDTIPDLVFDKVINYTKETIKISDFKDRLLILDFWTTYCSACIESFPKLEHIQNEYKTEAKIVLVSEYQGKAHNQEFFEKREKAGKHISLPSIVGDTVLKQLFPHQGVPFVVWVDGDRVVRAITNHLAVTSKNLALMIEGQTMVLPEKRFQKSFDRTKPLFVNNNGGKDDGFIYRSMFAGYVDSIPYNGFVWQQDSTHTRLFLMNRTFDEMYHELFYRAYKNMLNRLSWEYLNSKGPVINLPANFQYRPRSEAPSDYTENYLFNRKNAFTYELILSPEKDLLFAYDKMQDELNDFFGLTVLVEEQDVDVLEISGQTRNISTTDTPTVSIDEEFINAKSVSLSIYIKYLNNTLELPFIVNTSDEEVKIDMKLSLKGDVLKNLYESFEQQGYHVRRTTKKIQRMVYKSKV